MLSSTHRAGGTRPLFSAALVDTVALLLLFALGWWRFGWLLRDSLFVYGDNPGQFARLWFSVQVGVQGWVPDWYAGYPELQFYPPGFTLLGRVVAALNPGGLEGDYNALLFLAALLPVFGCYGFCRYALGPGSVGAGVAAGVATGLLALLFPVQWGGVHAIAIGLTAERLAFGLVPYLLWAGWALVEQPRPSRVALTAGLLALLALMHPFHAPAPVLAMALYALARRAPWRTWLALGVAGLLAGALIAWWLVPLLTYRAFAAPLVRATLAETLGWLAASPVPMLWLGALAALPLLRPSTIVPRRAATVWALAALALLLPLGIWLDHALLIERLHLYLFDPIRFAAEYYLVLLLLPALALSQAWPAPARRFSLPAALPALVALAALALATWDSFQYAGGGWDDGEALFLSQVAAEPALAGLWETLAAGEGRVLYTSSYLHLPQAEGTRLPTALKTLTSYFSGREQVGGTFSHWSPVARLLWVGDPAARVLPERVEAEDDRTFLGIPWAEMDDERLASVAQAFNVGTLVTTSDDVQARTFLDGSANWQSYWNNGFFFLYRPTTPPPGLARNEQGRLPVERLSPTRWQLQLDPATPGPVYLSLAYFPTWEATSPSGPLPIHPDALGLMRLEPQGALTVTLQWQPPLAARLLRWPTLALAVALLLVTLWDIRPRRPASFYA